MGGGINPKLSPKRQVLTNLSMKLSLDMTKKDFMNKITNSQNDFFQRFLDILKEKDIKFCVVGGLAVNAYCEPVVSLDLDIVIAGSQVSELIRILSAKFKANEQLHSINISSPDSDLRIQIQTDLRYQEFIGRAANKSVLGYEIPVASLEDVLQGKIWAYEDTTRRPSKRQKDLADIMRLTETHPNLVKLLPDSIKQRLALSE